MKAAGLLLAVCLQASSAIADEAWVNSPLKTSAAAISEIRVQIEKEYGPFVSGAFLPEAKAAPSLQAFNQKKSAANAFKALYMWMATGKPSTPAAYSKLWDFLPDSEYENARLRFLWHWRDIGELKLVGMADRLLEKNPKDPQVLRAAAWLRTILKKDQDLTKADEYAKRALDLEPCAQTYYAVGLVKIMQLKHSPSNAKALGAQARMYFTKYMEASDPRDSFDREGASDMLTWLKNKGY